MGCATSVADRNVNVESTNHTSKHGPSTFHDFCGKNVTMTEDRKTACCQIKTEDLYNLVFSAEPLNEEEVFSVKVRMGRVSILVSKD